MVSGALARMLHEDHVRTLAVLNALEQRIGGRRGRRPPDPADGDDQALLRDAVAAFEHDVERHFAFEEALLFPLVADAGAGDLAVALTHDHEAISVLGKRLEAMARLLLAGAPEAEPWSAFRAVAEELIGRATLHIQKEEMAVIQRLGTLLDDDMDARLAARFAEHRAAGPAPP